MNNLINIDELKIIKTLGYGMFGTVYKVEYKKKFYAMKIEHVLEKDLILDKQSIFLREIDFCKNFASKYPNQFTCILKYDFIDNCTYKQKYSFPINTFAYDTQKHLLELKDSKWCIWKVYDLIDYTLNKIINKLTLKQIYSMIIQLCWIIKLMELNGYIHGDIHLRNIGVIKTKSKYINILGKQIPTFGYIFKLIDYGMVAHKSSKLYPHEKINAKYLFTNGEIISILHLLINNDNLWNWISKHNIINDYKNNLKLLSKLPENKYIKKITKNKDLQFIVFQIIFPEQFQKIILGQQFLKTFKPKFYIEILDLMLIIQNYNNIDLISKYFISKIND